MKRKRTEWALYRLSTSKLRYMELGFMRSSALETNTYHIVYGRYKRLKQKQWAYYVAFKRWLARNQLKCVVFWKGEGRG